MPCVTRRQRIAPHAAIAPSRVTPLLTACPGQLHSPRRHRPHVASHAAQWLGGGIASHTHRALWPRARVMPSRRARPGTAPCRHGASDPHAGMPDAVWGALAAFPVRAAGVARRRAARGGSKPLCVSQRLRDAVPAPFPRRAACVRTACLRRASDASAHGMRGAAPDAPTVRWRHACDACRRGARRSWRHRAILQPRRHRASAMP